MNADPQAMITEFTRRMSDIRQSRCQLSEELSLIGASLDEFLSSIGSINQRLKDIKISPPAQEAKPAFAPNMSPDDFKLFIEKILQGSLEAAGDKLSGRIMNMLKELKGLAGTEREAKIQQIKEVADSDMVDLSKLYMFEEVKSNLGEVGLEEKESKGIASSLERLRKLRGKSKPGSKPEDKKD